MFSRRGKIENRPELKQRPYFVQRIKLYPYHTYVCVYVKLINSMKVLERLNIWEKFLIVCVEFLNMLVNKQVKLCHCMLYNSAVFYDIAL